MLTKHLTFKNLWIGLAAFLLSLAFTKLTKIPEDFWNSALIGFGSFVIYSLPPEFSFQRKSRMFWIVFMELLICLVLACYSIHSPEALLVLIFGFLLGFFYVSSFAFLKIPIRKIPYLKSSIISLCWVLACVVFPQVNKNMELDWVEVIAHFCFFLALTIPFDIRDYDLDRGELKTMVQLLGVFTAKLIALVLLFGFGYLILFRTELKPNLLIFGGSLLFLGLLIPLSKKKFPSPYYASILDSSIILLALSYLIS